MKCRERVVLYWRNWRNVRRVPSRLTEFIKWSHKVQADMREIPHIELGAFQQEYRGGGANAQIEDAYKLDAANLLADPEKEVDLTLAHYWPEKGDFAARVRRMNVDGGRGTKPLKFAGREFLSVAINSSDRLQLTFKNCFIDQLHLAGSDARIELINTYVRWFRLIRVGELDLVGSAIQKVTVEPEKDKDPFRGRVVIKRTWLARDEIDGAGESQQLRNVRSYLMAKNNTLAAGVFHAAELALDRKHERFWSRRFSWVYEAFADYGNSVSRPLLWFFAGLTLIGALVYFFDAVAIGMGDEKLVWWQTDLAKPWLRAVVYPFQAVFNPLGIFSNKTLLIAKTWWWSWILTGLSLITALNIVFFVIALRRRFRLES